MKRKILVVDDSATERTLLSGFLKKEYDVICAASGAEAIEVLKNNYQVISAIILDLIMPDMDGYMVMRKIRNNILFEQIPIIIATALDDEESHEKSISYGANAFIRKPYSRTLLTYTLHNAIRLRETASMVATLRHDKLTGLLNRESFFTEAEHLIKRHNPGYYVISCFNIDNFKMINDQYGTHKGDEVLCHIADTLQEFVVGINGITCRFTADKFAILFPANIIGTEELEINHNKAINPNCVNRRIRVRIGRYLVNDLSLSISAMFDRASIAQESIKGRFDTYIANYDDSMIKVLIAEQQIVTNMSEALAKNEFEAWFQPQYNHVTGAMIGAEALVRWKKDGVYISPGEFIPVFERNGFIYEMDQYIWEQVCILLKKWIDEGRSPVPISVNISRRDMFHKHFIQVLTGIIDKYSIPYELIRLEITESAFSKSPKQIIKDVEELVNLGFTVEIDDFGSGYSSLNTLKDVPASILKLDMNFFANTEHSQRSGNIVESVVRMAKWLGMAVIAEGVEEKSQADYLRSIGCFYIQGYYYAKPMPQDEFIKCLDMSVKEPELSKLKTLESLNNSEFWNPKSIETLIFNSYVGGACIFEYHNGETELLRVNEQYGNELGQLMPERTKLIETRPVRFLDKENREKLFANIRNAIETKKESTCELKLCNTRAVPVHTEYIRSTVRLIAIAGDRYLFYCVIVNMTALRMSERKEHNLSLQLGTIMENIHAGVTATVFHGKNDVEIVFSNDKFYNMYDYTKELAEEEIPNILDLIIPEDREETMQTVEGIVKSGGSATYEYRCRKRDGSIIWIQCTNSVIKLDGIDGTVLLAVTHDVTELRETQRKAAESANWLKAVMDNAGNGITAIALREDTPEFLFANDKYFEIIGYNRNDYARLTANDMFSPVHPEDRQPLKKIVTNINKNGKSATVEYRVIKSSGNYVWVRSVITITRLAGIDVPVQIAVFSDIDDEKKASNQLKFLNDSAHELLAQPDCDKAILDTMLKLLKYFNAERVYIMEDNRENNITDNTYEVLADGISSLKEYRTGLPINMSGRRKDRNLILKDVSEAKSINSEFKKILIDKNITSTIVVPLLRDGNQIGCISIDNPKNSWDQVDQIMAIGDYIAILMTRRDMSHEIELRRNAIDMMINDTPGGFCRLEIHPDKNPTLVIINDGFSKMMGMTNSEIIYEYGDDAFKCLLKEDINTCSKDYRKSLSTGKLFSAKLRLVCKNDRILWVMVFARFIKEPNGKTFINAYFTDITEQYQAENKQRKLLDNMPYGAALYEYDGKNISVIHINKRYWELINREPVDYSKTSVLNALYEDDRDAVINEINSAIKENRNFSCNARIRFGETGYQLFHIEATCIPKSDGKYSLYAAYSPIPKENKSDN